MRIGICGAGIAGPTLAAFLVRAGHEVTLIEKAPRLRTGGYLIDFWGVGYDVAERLGLIGPILERGYKVREIRMMRADGRVGGGFSAGVFDRMTGGRFVSLARGDLAEVIHGAVAGRVEEIFGDTVVAVEDRGDGVDAVLERGGTRRFDLLVGADGLHSRLRSLVWGEASRFERPLGYAVAAFRLPDYAPRDEDVYVTFQAPGRSLARFAQRDGATLVLAVFVDGLLPGGVPEDLAGRKAALGRVFGGAGWETEAILAALAPVEEVYFDRVSQIEMPEWSRGRVALIGDAAGCPSLLAGEGTGLAMTEAYVLAGELARAEGVPAPALARWERRLKGFVTDKQAAARGTAGTLVPKTVAGVWTRRIASRMLAVPMLADLMIGRSIRDDIDLPDYGL